jgi:hypothetical protein
VSMTLCIPKPLDAQVVAMLEEYIQLLLRKCRGRCWNVEDELKNVHMRKGEEVWAYYHRIKKLLSQHVETTGNCVHPDTVKSHFVSGL